MDSFGYSGFILHYLALSDKKSHKYLAIQLHKTNRSLHKMICRDQICQRSPTTRKLTPISIPMTKPSILCTKGDELLKKCWVDIHS